MRGVVAIKNIQVCQIRTWNERVGNIPSYSAYTVTWNERLETSVLLSIRRKCTIRGEIMPAST